VTVNQLFVKAVALAAAVAAQQGNVRNKMATHKEFDKKGYNQQSGAKWQASGTQLNWLSVPAQSQRKCFN